MDYSRGGSNSTFEVYLLILNSIEQGHLEFILNDPLSLSFKIVNVSPNNPLK